MEEEAEPCRVGAMGGLQLMGNSPMLWTETKNRAPGHLRKGKLVTPETVWPGRGRAKGMESLKRRMYPEIYCGRQLCLFQTTKYGLDRLG